MLCALTLVLIFGLPDAREPEPAASAQREESTRPPAQSLSRPETQPETQPETEPATGPETEPATGPETEPYLIAIDAGHQSQGDYAMEPVGPGSSESKYRASGGTQGVATGLAEYELNLQVSLLLKQELLDRGYEVLIIRETNDVSLSNAERAAAANEAGADVFVRVHANGSEDASMSGVMTICMTPVNPYNAELYAQSRALSDAVLEQTCAATGARELYVWETDTMAGINYCQMPVTIVEMGFMSNPEEDRRMATPEYQALLAGGIADGIDRYIAEQAASGQDDSAPAPDPALRAALEEAMADLTDKWVVYAQPLSGESVTVVCKNVEPDAPLVSASIIKLFIMAAVFDQAEQGLLEMDSGVYNDVYSMITESSNDAANRLTRLLGGGDEYEGMDLVNAFNANMGCTGTSMNRLMLVENGLQNYVTAQDCALLLRRIYEGKCVSRAASAQMWEILLDQTSTEYLPAGLPSGTPVAHKTGSLIGWCLGDVGIVMAEKNPYIVCIICNEPYDFGTPMAKIPELSKLIYQYLQSADA